MKKTAKKNTSFIYEAKHILFSASLLKPLAVFAVSLLVLSSLLYFGYHERPEQDAVSALASVHRAVETELQEIAKFGDAAALSSGLVEAIEAEDAEAIAKALKPQLTERGLSLYNVVNAQGVVITRTQTQNKIGDNFFVNNPLGRKMIESGENLSAIEARATDPR